MLCRMIEERTGSRMLTVLRVDATTTTNKSSKQATTNKKSTHLYLATSGFSGYQKSETAGG